MSEVIQTIGFVLFLLTVFLFPDILGAGRRLLDRVGSRDADASRIQKLEDSIRELVVAVEGVCCDPEGEPALEPEGDRKVLKRALRQARAVLP